MKIEIETRTEVDIKTERDFNEEELVALFSEFLAIMSVEEMTYVLERTPYREFLGEALERSYKNKPEDD